MANEVKNITKQNWSNRFNLVGKPKIGEYTYRIDEHSTKSSWVYNSMNLGIDCGEKYGVCYASLMAGYSPERANTIYVHGKDDNGNDDFKNRFEVDWDDRKDDDVLDTIGDMCFIKVGIEQTTQGNNFTKRFLSAYDAIAYIKEYLTDDMVVSVSGNLKYSMYNGNVQMNKEITSIYLSRVEDPAQFHATFTQSILIDKDSASLKEVDKSTGIMYVDAIVLDYMKEFNGHEIRGQFPYHYQFEYEFDLSKPDICKKRYDKMFKVKKGYTQITFEGDFVSGNSSVSASWDDVPDDIKELVELGIYTEEEALEKCSDNGSREHHMFLRRPVVIMQGNEDNKTPNLQMFPEAYTEDDLDMSWAMNDANDEDDDELPFGNSENSEDGSTGDDLDWLADL